MPKNKDIEKIDIDLLERKQVINWLSKEGVNIEEEDLKIKEIAVTDRTKVFTCASKSSALVVPASLDQGMILTKIDLKLLSEIIKTTGTDGKLYFTESEDYPAFIEYEDSKVVVVLMPLDE